MHKILINLFLASVSFLFSISQVDAAIVLEGAYSSGGGGNVEELEWQNIAVALAGQIKLIQNPDITRKISESSLLDAIDNTFLQSADKVFVKNPFGEYVEKDASNDPTLNPSVIYISLSRWKNLETDKKRALVLHEYLGILGLEKNHYRLSNLILSELSQIERENFNAENRVNVINKCNNKFTLVDYLPVQKAAYNICIQARNVELIWACDGLFRYVTSDSLHLYEGCISAQNVEIIRQCNNDFSLARHLPEQGDAYSSCIAAQNLELIKTCKNKFPYSDRNSENRDLYRDCVNP